MISWCMKLFKREKMVLPFWYFLPFSLLNFMQNFMGTNVEEICMCSINHRIIRYIYTHTHKTMP